MMRLNRRDSLRAKTIVFQAIDSHKLIYCIIFLKPSTILHDDLGRNFRNKKKLFFPFCIPDVPFQKFMNSILNKSTWVNTRT